jgi:hypothetical protein
MRAVRRVVFLEKSSATPPHSICCAARVAQNQLRPFPGAHVRADVRMQFELVEERLGVESYRVRPC